MRRVSAALAAALGLLALGAEAFAQAAPGTPDKVKIGYAISKTGPFTGGASITTLPVYQLWVKEVNAAGGLKIGDKRVPIEVIEYDDRSNSEEAIKAIERLAAQDKVDFILPPWGTGQNLAVGPILARLGYPHLAVTTNTNRAPELAKRWPNASFWLGLPADISVEMVALLKSLRDQGKIGPTVAMIAVSDQFGIELSTAARDAFAKAGFKLAYDKSYPAGTQDMQPMLKDAMATSPDVFVSFSYPPDTLAVTDAAKVLSFNPKVFFTGVGTAFPLFKQRFGGNADGVMGIGGWNADSALLKDYLERHKAGVGREPDRWANPITFASLQALQQAIERVGLDRAAVIKELQNGSFDTIIGKVKLDGGLLKDVWAVGQWQNGEFYGIAPTKKDGARAAIVPKPAWGP
ncbi:amino acid ABC transporter substrate-binding protein [Rhodoplanes azumiensis]|uniref:Amino acid ABC transporter substrate-binding protein n=1 Tax=Rhodoplanes azumiensis TaxID=1897628 RepID=A0ABW5AC51_9BRAD